MEAALTRGLSGERDGEESHGKLFCEPVCPPHPHPPCFSPIPRIPLIFKALGARLPVTFKCVVRPILMGDMQI